MKYEVRAKECNPLSSQVTNMCRPTRVIVAMVETFIGKKCNNSRDNSNSTKNIKLKDKTSTNDNSRY